MALRENHILVDIMADADPLRDINRQINDVTRNAQLMGSTINSQGDYVVRNYRRMSDATNWMMTSTRGMSQEALEMRREMQQAMYAGKRAMYPFRDELIKAEYGMFKLTQSAKNYTGTNREFMREVQAAGAAHKKATDAMIAADEMQKMSMIRTVGTLLNRTTQAQRVIENYNRMGNPFYRVNNGLLGIADGMNKIAMRGQPAALALKMLGPTANMKKLRDMTMMIQQGMMRFTMVALLAAAGAAIFYKKLHDGAMEANKGYKKAFEDMSKSLSKAFEPLVEVFAMIMIPIFRFIKAIADMVVRFNEAHPTIAKLVAAFLVLIPILTLILSPLAIGIGLFGGLQAALAAVWPFIAPVVTGLAAMMGTVILVSAAIVGLVYGIRHLWTTNEAFRTAVIGAWEAIRAKAQEVFGWLADFLGPILSGVLEKVTTFATTAMDAIKNAFTGDMSSVFDIFKNLAPTIIGFLIGGLPGLLISASRFIPTIIEGIQSRSADIATTATDLINKFVMFITTNLPRLVEQGVAILTNIVQGIVTNLPIVLGAVTQLLTFIVSTITTLLPVLVQAGVSILTAILNAIITNLPVLITAALQILQTLIQSILTLLPMLLQAALGIIMTLIQNIITLLPMILQAGVQILMTLIQGILQILPTLIPVVMQIITTIVNMIVQNLPLILNAGIQILMMLIQGIISMLPQLITVAIQLITSIADMLIQNLPMIINAAVQIVVSLINGLIQMLPQLVAAALQLLTAIFNIIIENLPQMLALGVQLIQALINGVLQLIGAVGTAMGQIVTTIIDTVSGIDLFSIGSDIVQGLINGIGSMLDSLAKTAGEIASTVMEKTKGILGINSPSKVFFDYGGWTTEGYALGMQKEFRMVDAMAREMAFTVSQPVAGITPETSSTSTTNSTSDSKVINFNPTINVQGGEGGEGGDVRQQVRDAMDEAFAHLLDLYDPEVAY